MTFDDDTALGPINLNQSFYFDSTSFSPLYICSNGFVSNKYSTTYTFSDLNSTRNIPLIGPLLIDLKNNGDSSIYYRETSNQTILDQIKYTMLGSNFSQYSSFAPIWGFIVTWKDISIYGTTGSTYTNTFQLVITKDSNCRSFVLFLYEKLNITDDKLSNVKAGYTLNDAIHYLSISDEVKALFKNSSRLPLSLVYPLNSLQNCSSITSTSTSTSTVTSTSTSTTTDTSTSTIISTTD